MSLQLLAEDRSWLQGVRESADHSLKSAGHDDPLYRSMVQYGMRLVDLALDYHLAGLTSDLNGIDSCVLRIGTVGREFTGSADDIGMAERLTSIGIISTCFVEGLLHVIRKVPLDAYMGPFLSATLMTWGIFYDKVEIDFPDVGNGP